MISPPSPDSEMPPPQPTLCSQPSNRPGRSPPCPRPAPCPQHTHTHPLLGPTTQAQMESDSSSRPDRVQGTRPSPCWGNTDRQAAPQKTITEGTADSQKHKGPGCQSNTLGAGGGRGTQGGARSPSAGEFEKADGAQCWAGRGRGQGTRVLWVKVSPGPASGDSGLADRRHSHLTCHFWADV